MPYVDAFFDRDADIIRAVERRDGKRHYQEYQAKYTFYYEDAKGKHKSIYGDPLTRIVCKNTKDFRKELAINKGKKMFESDVNPILSHNSIYFLVSFADLRDFTNSSLILSELTPFSDGSFCKAFSKSLSKLPPNLAWNLKALNFLNASSSNLSSALPTVLIFFFLRSAIPPTKSTISFLSIS